MENLKVSNEKLGNFKISIIFHCFEHFLVSQILTWLNIFAYICNFLWYTISEAFILLALVEHIQESGRPKVPPSMQGIAQVKSRKNIDQSISLYKASWFDS